MMSRTRCLLATLLLAGACAPEGQDNDDGVRDGVREISAASCGAPRVNLTLEAGVYLWRDCNSSAWHLRVSSGGRSGVRYAGSITSASITAFSPFGLESEDVLTQDGPRRTFSLTVWPGGLDGFDFSFDPASGSLVLELSTPAGARVFVGPQRTRATLPLELGDDGGGGEGGGEGGTNLAPITDGKWHLDKGWAAAPAANVYLEPSDSSDRYAGLPTWRVVPLSSTANNAVDHDSIPIEPGDRVVMKCWIKTGGSTPETYAGARLGIDTYAGSSTLRRINGCNSVEQAAAGTNPHVGIDENYVHWGSDWTQKVWDFTVPATYTGDGWLPSGYPTGTKVVPTRILPWLQVYKTGYPDGAHTAWFSGFELYVYKKK